MATDKRERQRANRAAKQAAEAKAARRAKVIDRSRRVAIWVAAILVVFILANVAFGGGDATPATTLVP